MRGIIVIGKIKSWHNGLSQVSRWVFWAVITVIGLFALGSATTETPKPKEVNVQSAAAVKEPVMETKTITETQEVPYTSTMVDDATLDKGKTSVRTAGVKGIKTLTYVVTLKDGVQQDKKLQKEEITTEPITEVTAIGTYVKPTQKSCDPNYTPCIPYVSYDLDCPDIGFQVTVIGTDRHRLDGNDNDGLGCESY